MNRKPRRPRWPANRFAHMNAINRLEPFSETELANLEQPLRKSFAAIKTGTAAEADFHDLCAAVNVVLIRGEQIDPQVEQAALDAINALERTWARYQTTGSLAFDGLGMTDIEVALEVHEQLIRLSTPLQLMNSLKEVVRRGHEQGAPA